MRPITRSTIRWFNDRDVAVQVLDTFGFEKVQRFCVRGRPLRHDEEEDNDEWATELAALDKKLLDFFSTADAAFKLHIELLVLKHYGEPIHEACYHLEGDAPLLPYAAGHLEHVRVSLNVGPFILSFVSHRC